jgi:anti-anti-sigma regulatory factor
MLETALGWNVRVDRGPDWLFLRLEADPASPCDYSGLGEQLWHILDQHFIYRLILEMDGVPTLPSALLGQLVLLHKRIAMHQGIMRLAGLSDENQRVLESSRMESRFPHYRSRAEALMGHRPPNPR